MVTNRDLLKEAIADAKAVKETAIANAKAALEEAFTPQLKTMFAAKLQEMESMEDEIEETHSEYMNEEEDMEYMNEEEDMMEVDLEELLAELNEEEVEVEETLNEVEDGEEDLESEESEEMEVEGEPVDMEDMTDEDLKSMIEDVIKDMIEAGELEAGHEGEEAEEEAEEDIEIGDDEDNVDLAELLREIEEMDDEPIHEEELEELFGMGKKGSGGTSFIKGFIKDNEEEIDRTSDSGDKNAAKLLITKFYNENIRKMDGAALRSDVSVLRVALGLEELGGATKGSTSIREDDEELNEAYSTIETLKNELNEINLLNAKLLYTNKIFKVKNLNESQKVKVLSSFDKATTVGEVKMVFTTLNEGIKETKSIIKENRGSASKMTHTPTIKKPIVESNDAFLRMQKLAGII